jgi:tetratricopeptide (TPR) repeat protein
MKAKSTFLVFLTIGLLSSFNHGVKKNAQSEQKVVMTGNPVIGKWVRIGPAGSIGFDFKENGLVEVDFGKDQTIDVIAKYEIKKDTIIFTDEEGQMCKDNGQYKIYQTDYYLAFDLIDDNCNGRIKITTGFWTKPNFKDFLAILEKEISNAPKPEDYLNRARIYMAIGIPEKAKTDFDIYLKNDSTNARVFINRAGTRFPNDMKGVVFDCNKAISLESNNKNAYFLRGLALYELGEKKQACEDFNKAIELGFSILRIAEKEKCAEYWDEE